MSKRQSEETEEASKRMKSEPEPSLLDDELNSLLSQQIPTENNIDFNNLPDDLLDSVDANVSTPDVSTPNLNGRSLPASRSATPQPERNQLQAAKFNSTSNIRTHPQSQIGQSQSQQNPHSQLSQSQSDIQVPQAPAQVQSQSSQPQAQPQTQQAQAQAQAQSRNELHSNDPTKLNDAIAAAGVDIHQEEELLQQQRMNRMARMPTYSNYDQLQPQQRNSGVFLNPYHVATFMYRVARDNGVVQNFLQDTDLLELMSVSCENWMSNIITKTIIMARHRRKSIMTSNKSKASTQKSEVSKELRNLALRQKELEEKRVNKRIALGLEKHDENKDDANKAGSDETLHRAANATAAMMTMNPGRKKYSWMTANAGDTGDQANKENDTSKKSHLLSVRGDNGLRFREIRSGQSVAMKDLLSAIEDEKMGVEKSVIKGYSKLRD